MTGIQTCWPYWSGTTSCSDRHRHLQVARRGRLVSQWQVQLDIFTNVLVTNGKTESSHARPSHAVRGACVGPARGRTDLPGHPTSSRQAGGGGPGAGASRTYRAVHAHLSGGVHAPRRDPFRMTRPACRQGNRDALGPVGREHRSLWWLCSEPPGSDLRIGLREVYLTSGPNRWLPERSFRHGWPSRSAHVSCMAETRFQFLPVEDRRDALRSLRRKARIALSCLKRMSGSWRRCAPSSTLPLAGISCSRAGRRCRRPTASSRDFRRTSISPATSAPSPRTW